MGNEWTLRARCDEGVLVVAASGRATQDSLKILRGFILTLVAQKQARAVLVDFTEADAEMDPEQWFENAKESARRGPEMPLAMVVRPEYFEEVAKHCVTVAMLGLTRMAFMRCDFALDWCHFELQRAAPVEAAPLAASRKFARMRLVHSSP